MKTDRANLPIKTSADKKTGDSKPAEKSSSRDEGVAIKYLAGTCKKFNDRAESKTVRTGERSNIGGMQKNSSSPPVDNSEPSDLAIMNARMMQAEDKVEDISQEAAKIESAETDSPAEVRQLQVSNLAGDHSFVENPMSPFFTQLDGEVINVNHVGGSSIENLGGLTRPLDLGFVGLDANLPIRMDIYVVEFAADLEEVPFPFETEYNQIQYQQVGLDGLVTNAFVINYDEGTLTYTETIRQTSGGQINVINRQAEYSRLFGEPAVSMRGHTEGGNFVVSFIPGPGRLDVSKFDNHGAVLSKESFNTVGGVDQMISSTTYGEGGYIAAERFYDEGQNLILINRFDADGVLASQIFQQNDRFIEQEYDGGKTVSHREFFAPNIESDQTTEISFAAYGDGGGLTSTINYGEGDYYSVERRYENGSVIELSRFKAEGQVSDRTILRQDGTFFQTIYLPPDDYPENAEGPIPQIESTIHSDQVGGIEVVADIGSIGDIILIERTIYVYQDDSLGECRYYGRTVQSFSDGGRLEEKNFYDANNERFGNEFYVRNQLENGNFEEIDNLIELRQPDAAGGAEVAVLTTTTLTTTGADPHADTIGRKQNSIRGSSNAVTLEDMRKDLEGRRGELDSTNTETTYARNEIAPNVVETTETTQTSWVTNSDNTTEVAVFTTTVDSGANHPAHEATSLSVIRTDPTGNRVEHTRGGQRVETTFTDAHGQLVPLDELMPDQNALVTSAEASADAVVRGYSRQHGANAIVQLQPQVQPGGVDHAGDSAGDDGDGGSESNVQNGNDASGTLGANEEVTENLTNEEVERVNLELSEAVSEQPLLVGALPNYELSTENGAAPVTVTVSHVEMDGQGGTQLKYTQQRPDGSVLNLIRTTSPNQSVTWASQTISVDGEEQLRSFSDGALHEARSSVSEDGSVTLEEETINLQHPDANSDDVSVVRTVTTTTERPDGSVRMVVDLDSYSSLGELSTAIHENRHSPNRVHTEIATIREAGADGAIRETRTQESTSSVDGIFRSSSSTMQILDPDGASVVESLSTTQTDSSNTTVTRTIRNHETVARVEDQGVPVEALSERHEALVDTAELSELSALLQHADRNGEASVAGMVPSGLTLESHAQEVMSDMAKSGRKGLAAFNLVFSYYAMREAVKSGDTGSAIQGGVGLGGGIAEVVSTGAEAAADLLPSATESLLALGKYAGRASGLLGVASVGWQAYDLSEAIQNGDTSAIVEDSVNLAGVMASTALAIMADAALIGGPAGALAGVAIGVGTVGFDLLWDRFHPHNARSLGSNNPGVQPNIPVLSPEAYNALPAPSEEARLWTQQAIYNEQTRVLDHLNQSGGIVTPVVNSDGVTTDVSGQQGGVPALTKYANIANGNWDANVKKLLAGSHTGESDAQIEQRLSNLKKACAYLVAYPSEFASSTNAKGKINHPGQEGQNVLSTYPDGLPSFNEAAEAHRDLGAQNPAIWRLGNFGQPNSHQPLAYEKVVQQNFDEIDGFGRPFQNEKQNDGALGWEEMAGARAQALQNKQYDLYFSLDYVMRHGATLFPNAGEGETLKLSSDQLTQRITTDQNQRTAAITLLDAGFSTESAVKYAPSMTPEEFESEDFNNRLRSSITNDVSAPLALLQARYSTNDLGQASQREMGDEGFLAQWALEPHSSDSLQKTRSSSILDMLNTRDDLSEYGIDYSADFEKIYDEDLTAFQADKLFSLGPDRVSYIHGKMESSGSMLTLSLKEISNLSAAAADELMKKLKSASSAQAVNEIVYQNKITDTASAFYTLAANQLNTAAGQVSSDNAGLPPDAMKKLVGNLTLFEVLHTESPAFTSTLAQYKAQLEAPESEPDHELVEEAPTYTDTLKLGEELNRNEPLKSADGRYELLLQDDGNLVIYGATDPDRNNKRVIWESETVGSGATTLALQGDGNLVLYDAGGQAVWATNTNQGKATHLLLHSDGRLELYEGTTECLWKTEKDPFANAVWVMEGAEHEHTENEGGNPQLGGFFGAGEITWD